MAVLSQKLFVCVNNRETEQTNAIQRGDDVHRELHGPFVQVRQPDRVTATSRMLSPQKRISTGG